MCFEHAFEMSWNGEQQSNGICAVDTAVQECSGMNVEDSSVIGYVFSCLISAKILGLKLYLKDSNSLAT